jgi:DNA-binding transcriptional ArsR family regulator
MSPRFALSVPADHLAAIDERARQQSMTRSAIVREAIAVLLEAGPGSPPPDPTAPTLEALRAHGPLKVVEIVEITGMPSREVYRHIEALRQAGHTIVRHAGARFELLLKEVAEPA